MTQLKVIIWQNSDPEFYDVLPYFRNEYKQLKKELKPKARYEWESFIRSRGMSRFWAQAQYEIVISPWPNQDKHRKIDVWKQIEGNLDLIIDILMNELP